MSGVLLVHGTYSFTDVDIIHLLTITISRVKSAIIHANTPDHFREQVLTSDGTKEADLYGPVWISMTLMFLFAVTGNTSKYLKNDAQDVEYDISHLSKAFSILMVYTFCVPSALFIMMQCVNVNVGLVEIIALYGYSLVPYLPVTILCLIPSSWLEVIFLLAASILSLLLIARNLTGPIMKSNSRWGASMCMAVVCVHFVFFLIFKIVFYSHHSHASGNNHNGSSNAGKTDDDIDDDGQLNRFFL